jgi:hypothetical protein
MGPYGLFLHGHSRMGVERVFSLLLPFTSLPSFLLLDSFSIYMEFWFWDLIGLPMFCAVSCLFRMGGVWCCPYGRLFLLTFIQFFFLLISRHTLVEVSRRVLRPAEAEVSDCCLGNHPAVPNVQ